MTIDDLIQNFYVQKEATQKKIEELDESFSNKKLNPYGVTTIEFQERSDAYSQKSRLEGAIDALCIVKREIFNDDGEVEIPNLNKMAEEEEIETIGQTSEMPDTFPN